MVIDNLINNRSLHGTVHRSFRFTYRSLPEPVKLYVPCLSLPEQLSVPAYFHSYP